MRSGRLDKRIKLQRKTISENSFGEPIETWADIKTVWAEYLPMRGAERYASAQTIAEADTRWRIRYRDGITPVDRIYYNNTVYDVQSVVELGRKSGLELYTKTRAE